MEKSERTPGPANEILDAIAGPIRGISSRRVKLHAIRETRSRAGNVNHGLIELRVIQIVAINIDYIWDEAC